MTKRFDLFIGVDWSGAQGKYQKGIQVALARKGNSAPYLVTPDNTTNWSRLAVLRLLSELSEEKTFLAGFDFSFTPPFIDEGYYFPGTSIQASRGEEFWREVEKRTGNDPYLHAGSFLKDPEISAHFQIAYRKGNAYRRRFRVTEDDCKKQGLGSPETFFNLIGRKQVGMASLCGIRFLYRLPRHITIWPFEHLRKNASTVVEIYTRPFQVMGGATTKKITDAKTLNLALAKFASEPVALRELPNDHAADALLSAAALRHISKDEKYWNPKGLTKNVRLTEGWTFGVP